MRRRLKEIMHTRPWKEWWPTALFCLIMFIIAAAANGTMDKLSFRYGESIFAKAPPEWQHWLNPAISWPNKWKNGDRKQGDRFPLSSTALVWTTDAWHLAKTIMLSCFVLAILAPFRKLVQAPWWAWVLVFIGISLLWGTVFEFLFGRGLN